MSNNKYQTEWEVEMKESIDKQVTDELDRILEGEKRGPAKKYSLSSIACELFREKKSKELEYEYRINHTLELLEQIGLDMEAFKNTWMYSCGRFDYVLEVIQATLDGFNYNKNGHRVLKRKPMDLSKTTVELSAGHIIIKTPRSSYDIFVDEHQLIYVNGRKALNLRPMKTPQEDREEAIRFMEDMRANRLDRERKSQRSLIAARNTWTGQV